MANNEYNIHWGGLTKTGLRLDNVNVIYGETFEKARDDFFENLKEVKDGSISPDQIIVIQITGETSDIKNNMTYYNQRIRRWMAYNPIMPDEHL